MIVRLGLLAVLFACAVAPVSADVPSSDEMVAGEQVVRPESPHSAALVPMPGVVLAGATEGTGPTQSAAGPSRGEGVHTDRERRTARMWTVNGPHMGACARSRVLRL